MRLSRKRIVIIAACLLVAAVVVSFSLLSSWLNNRTALAGEPEVEAGRPGINQVETVDEASQIVGYRVVTPAYLPPGIKSHKVYVMERGPADMPKHVQQIWTFEDASLDLTQDPVLAGIGGGEEFEICGVTGQRQLLEARGAMPYRSLVLYWRDGEMAYVLTGTLNGPLDEATIMKVAESIS